MEIREIKKIVELMSQHDLSEFVLEDEHCSLQLKRGVPGAQTASGMQTVMMPAPAAPVQVAAPAANPAPTGEKAGDDQAGLVEITSPMVGTFYRSPSPDSDAFVEPGDEVGVTSVVCIVEAMKVMNEIQADVKGRIKKVLVENATAVQFGQPLFLVEPA